MLNLTDQEKELLAQQRLDAPILQAVRDALALLGAEPARASLDRGMAQGFELQTRSAFALSKALRMAPPQAAKALAGALDPILRERGLGWASPSPDYAALAKGQPDHGTGFVNIGVDPRFAMAQGLGSDPLPGAPWLRALVDYSSPNCAKRMHVGHLRSTVIGDAICRLMEGCGADVERVNHLGDWGTPFGVIIEQAREEGLDAGSLDLLGLEGVYQRGAARMGAAVKDGVDPQARADGQAFAQRARATTAQMQQRQEPAYGIWERVRSATLAQLQGMYALLDIGLKPEHAVGESAYQDEAGPLIERLVEQGLAVRGDQGVAFLGAKTPLALEKSASAGGGLLYGGTDAAALARRGPSGRKLLYVTDARQADHFAALFELGLRAGWTQPGQAIHVPFGMMLDASGAPFKSRSGGAMPLSELVEDALSAAREVIREKSPDATDEQVEAFARPIGVGALKYADLSRNRASSVKFDPKAAAAMQGDTGPYLQYARARAVSAAKAAEGLPTAERHEGIHPREAALAWALCRLRSGAIDALELLSPHHLCMALFEAASAFGSFYESCPCVQGAAADPVRLDLMRSFASAMGRAMLALGIEPLDEMPRPQKRPQPAP